MELPRQRRGLLLTQRRTLRSRWESLSPEVQDMILDYMTLADLDNLSRVFASLTFFTQGHLRRRITALFSRFHLRYPETMAMMQSTNARMTGLAVVDVVYTSNVRTNTLEVVATDDHYTEVEDFFIAAGYSIVQQEAPMVVHRSAVPMPPVNASVLPANDRATYLPNMAIDKVVNLTHQKYGTRVKIVHATTNSSLPPILTFSTTLVMNWITHDTVVCAYPDLTLNGKAFKNTLPWYTHTRVEATLEYLKDQGFEILDRCTQQPHHSRKVCNSMKERGRNNGQSGRVYVHPYCQRKVRALEDDLSCSMGINRPLWETWPADIDTNDNIVWNLCRRSEGTEMCRTRKQFGERAGAHQGLVWQGDRSYHPTFFT
ncbi:hypothetical protein BKA70DRAFT_1425458 [Coprinopsis sp. MPI-PUGE-AT-0042]|nr:hypothetical protein BKA70DRAFT_1425458 [Coprinopsis sp. MPI-PUGE-AT-0042]